MKRQSLTIYISLTLAMIFWSFSFIWYKDAFVYYKPITLIFLRLIISSIFLFIFTSSIGRLNQIHLKDIKYFIILAFFEPFLYFIGESFGVSMISSTLAAVIITTIPLFSPIGAYYFLNEKISKMNFIGIVISIIGVGLVIFHNGFGKIDANPLGVALMFLAVGAALGYSIVIKKLSVRYGVFSIVTYQNSIGILFFLPLFFIFEYKHFVTIPITLDALIPLLKLAIFASSFAFIFWTYSIKHIGISKANIFTNGIPVLTAIIAYYKFGETLTFVKMIGIGVVIGGLLLSQLNMGKINSLFVRNGDKD